MSSASQESFENLESKILRVLNLLENEKSEAESLRLRNIELEEQLRLDADRIKNLEEKYQKVKISKVLLESSENVHEAKLKVNRMVREIDHCIALLNR